MTQTDKRLDLYRRILQRRLDRAEKEVIRVPHLRGLRLRLPGKPFHATPEIFFQEGGRTRFELPNENMTVGPGEVMLLPARMPHGEQFSGASFLTVIVMFQFESASLHFGFLENHRGPIHIGPIDRFQSIDQFAVIRYADEMTAISGSDALSRRLRQTLYLALLVRLIQGLRPSGIAPPIQNSWIIRCREMIDVYYCKMDFSVTWLAGQMGCSPDHISRRFRAYTGYRIMEMVHRMRIDHARRCLQDSDMNIAEVAWACGYSQPSYFNHMFKKLAGTTPKEFRHGPDHGT